MRKIIALIAILMASLPSMALTKITVEQLAQLLAEQHKLAKSDESTAVKLQDVSLSEQLTADKMNTFTQYEPGPLTVTQIRVLAIDSALLPPPASDLPSMAAPDFSTQAAIPAIHSRNYCRPRSSSARTPRHSGSARSTCLL